MKRSSHLVLASLFVAAIAAPEPARATLGDRVDSTASERRALPTTQGTTAVNPRDYWVRESVYDSATVREYVSASGVVFAVAWEGLTHPDLTTLLGTYAPEYREALASAPRARGRRCHQVKTDRLVLEQWGHMRHLQGRAYATLLVPPGVSVDEIK